MTDVINNTNQGNDTTSGNVTNINNFYVYRNIASEFSTFTDWSLYPN